MSFEEVYENVKATMKTPVKERHETSISPELYEKIPLEDKIRLHLVSLGYFEGETFVPFEKTPYHKPIPRADENHLLHSVYFSTSTVITSRDPLKGFPDDHYLFTLPAVAESEDVPQYAGFSPKYALAKYESVLLAPLDVTTFDNPILLGTDRVLLTNGKRLFLYTVDRKSYWMDEAENDLPENFDIKKDVTGDLLSSRLGEKWVITGERLTDEDIEKRING